MQFVKTKFNVQKFKELDYAKEGGCLETDFTPFLSMKSRQKKILLCSSHKVYIILRYPYFTLCGFFHSASVKANTQYGKEKKNKRRKGKRSDNKHR